MDKPDDTSETPKTFFGELVQDLLENEKISPEIADKIGESGATLEKLLFGVREWADEIMPAYMEVGSAVAGQVSEYAVSEVKKAEALLRGKAAEFTGYATTFAKEKIPLESFKRLIYVREAFRAKDAIEPLGETVPIDMVIGLYKRYGEDDEAILTVEALSSFVQENQTALSKYVATSKPSPEALFTAAATLYDVTGKDFDQVKIELDALVE